MDSRVSALLDKQDIEEVVLRYCRGIDRRDFDLVRSCYHPDAMDHHGSFEGNVDAFIAWVDRLTSRYTWTMHLVGNVLVDLEVNETAKQAAHPEAQGVAVSETYGVSLHRSEDERPFMNLATGFRYIDRFERRDDVWRIADRHAVGQWSIPVPAEGWWDAPEEHPTGHRDASDALYSWIARGASIAARGASAPRGASNSGDPRS